VTGDEARGVFGQVMARVAVTIGLLALRALARTESLLGS
jgi:hypothetical protein